MPKHKKPDVKDILEKYGAKIEGKISSTKVPQKGEYTRAYTAFKKERSSELSRYEKWCNSLGKMIKLKVSEKDAIKI